jgi:hypothetical protein
MIGLKLSRCASSGLAGIDLLNMFHKGQSCTKGFVVRWQVLSLTLSLDTFLLTGHLTGRLIKENALYHLRRIDVQ